MAKTMSPKAGEETEAGSSASVDCSAVLEFTANGHWLDRGVFMCPLTLWAVVDKSRGEWFWFDFACGRWSAVLSQNTVTQNERFAKRVADSYSAHVETYSLVKHP